jgi:2-dehydro-3-deoxyphosphogalactonate aldolase
LNAGLDMPVQQHSLGLTWPTTLPLVAILRGIRPEEVLDHSLALIDAGFDAIEIPLNSPDWQSSVQILANHLSQNLTKKTLMGAGTVLRATDVAAVLSAGGQLIVTPNTNPSVIAQAASLGLHVVAGFGTASEAFAALEAGAQSLKMFPATTYGPAHVKALRAVLPPVPILAVGGITPHNLGDYLRAGCTGAGLGSDLYKPGQSSAQTSSHARQFVEAYQSATKA